ncbi:12574_t:CDS:2, partial [Dentiscutata erythropus]
TDEKIVPIANNSEQYITFSKSQTKTPEQLAKCFPIMSKFISPHLLSLLTRKEIFTYQWLTSKNKFKETQLPSRKDFNSDLNGVNYCEQGCESKKYANNLYGWAMSQYLPTGGFKWLSTKPLDASHPLVQKILTIKENSNRGCCLEVKLSIPKELRPKF